MDRPFVYINMATTVDGKITSAGREYPRFASVDDRRRMDLLRADADAILVGAGTVRADNPPLHVRDAAMRQRRLDAGRPAGLLRVVVTRSGRIAADSRFFDDDHDGGGRIVATIERAPDALATLCAGRAELWRIGRDDVNLAELLRLLRERGVSRLLCEGGGELNWGLVRADLADELYVTIAPALLGGQNAPTLLEGNGFPMNERRPLRLVDVNREGDELFCRYAVVR
jgi:riboflavin-specific deaminase-like protein